MDSFLRKNKPHRNKASPADLQDKTIFTRSQLLSSACSKSTLANAKRAKKILLEFAKLHNAPDPREFKANSSLLVLNLVAKYCNFGKPESLKNDSMGALVQGLRLVYDDYSHTKA